MTPLTTLIFDFHKMKALFMPLLMIQFNSILYFTLYKIFT